MRSRFRKVGIYHHPTQPAARDFAEEISKKLKSVASDVWISSAWDPVAATKELEGTELLICIGGDGTVLRASRAAIPHPIQILGVDMGRLAFLTELTPETFSDRFSDLVSGKYQVEERTMLEVQFHGFEDKDVPNTVHVLNDVVLGRTALGRPVYINLKVHGDLIGVIRSDALIVSTATGSTGYSLSAGGPILDPRSKCIVVSPVAPHLAAARPLVLSPDAVVELSTAFESPIVASVDGQGQFALERNDVVTVRRSDHIARMIRFGGKPFFTRVGRKLAWLGEHPSSTEKENSHDDSLIVPQE